MANIFEDVKISDLAGGLGQGGSGSGTASPTPRTVAPVPDLKLIVDTSDRIEGGGLNVNYQILPRGFGSYLQGVLPEDIAVACGAFSYSMQQVNKISNVPIEKFAQAVANLETTKDLPDVGGTSVPVDTSETQAALALVALGSGPNGTYTYSDFFGCMSGLPYPWERIQELIKLIQTPTLQTIYNNLYTAIQGPTPGLDAAVQAQIDLANAEISRLFNLRGTDANIQELIDLWEATGVQLGLEQQARDLGLPPLPDPRDDTLNIFPTVQYGFVDTLPQIAPETQPHMAAQTIENISDISLIAGQSMIGLLRESRNQDRLGSAGIPLYNNISDTLTPEKEKEWIANGTVDGSIPAYPADPAVKAIGSYDPTTDQYVLDDGSTLPTGDALPGSLAGSPYVNLVPPQLSTVYTSDVLPSAQYSINEAIDQVVACNCDCWVH
jgi:hypothetical protein